MATIKIAPIGHVGFVLGWPGIPGSTQRSRNQAHIAGNVEVRLGSKGLKAKWLRIELRKIETVPGGENWGELIGRGPIDVWSARTEEEDGRKNTAGEREQDADGSWWELLRTRDFPFRINIPEALPPSAKLDKMCGVQYEVVTSLCVKTKKGFMRKEDTSTIMQSVQPVTLDKHEMHSTWPAYNQPDTHSGERDQLRAKLLRDRYCYAPGDKVTVKVIVLSNRVEPAKLKSIAVTIKETVTFHGVKPSKKSLTSNSTSAQPSMQRVEVVTQKAKQIGKKLYKGDSKDFDLELVIPKSHALMTIATAKHVEVSYTMRLYVDIAKAPVVVDHIPMMMTTFPRQASLALIKKIGFVDGLSEREMVIDDDVDDDATSQGVTSRSARPAAPSRSLSFAGSTSTYDSGGNIPRSGSTTYLNRRDTVMTTATGGMAGRGIPGQLFTGGSYYGAPSPSPFGMANGVPRLAFAGPDAAMDEEQQLTDFERHALYHHTNDPRQALAVGVDYDAVASLEPTRSAFSPHRAITPSASPAAAPNQRASFAGFPTMQQPISRPSTANAAAEEEKERLYERARQQAERNQRKAAALTAAGAAAANGGTQQGGGGGRAQQPNEDGAYASSTLPASEAEKMRLWERARREAEAYQRSYADGATFPAGAASASGPSSRIHTPVLGRVDENLATPPMTSSARPAPARGEDAQRRSSAVFWLDHANGASAAASTTAQRAPVAATGAAASYPSYPSAEEEKRRLYDQAKAEADAHQAGVAGVGAGEASNRNSVVGGGSGVQHGTLQAVPMAASSSAPAGLSEKEQMRRYYEAQEAVQKLQSRAAQEQAGGSSAATAAGGSSMQATTVPASASAPTTTAKPETQLNEKEQMRRYYAAQEAVQQHQTRAEGASSSTVKAATSTMQPSGSAQGSSQTMANGVGGSSSAHPATSSSSAALSEKEQLARYHAAQAEVQRFQARQYDEQEAASTISHAAPASSSTTTTAAVAAPSSASAPQVASSSAATQQPHSEKEQMRQYWAARERETQQQAQAASPTVASPTLTSPRPMYAQNFHGGLPFSTDAAGAAASPATSPLPQAPFAASPFSSAAQYNALQQGGSGNTKPRVVSYTPSTAYSQQQQRPPALQPKPLTNATAHKPSGSLNMPMIGQLALDHRGSTPNPFDGPWASKPAPSWDSHGDASQRATTAAAPPPLPPKTVAGGAPRYP